MTDDELFLAISAHPLGEHVTERRRRRMAEVLQRRISSITVVLENLYDPHNTAAVVRSAEGFGLDRICAVEIPNRFKPQRAISMGADRWVEVDRYKGLAKCLTDQSAKGFTIAAADVGPGCVPLEELPLDRPLALVFGTERDGLSRRAKGLSDVRFTIPMDGFVESFNVSVSAAVALYALTTRKRGILAAEGKIGELDDETLVKRGQSWLKKTVKNAAVVERRMLAERAAETDAAGAA